MSFSFRLNFKVSLKIILLQLIILILLFKPINNLLDIFILFCFNIIPGKFVYIIFLAVLILLYALICLVHAGLHTLAYKIIRGMPKIGFKGVYAFTMETSGKQMSRKEFLIVLMMPVTVIPLICVALPWNVLNCLIT